MFDSPTTASGMGINSPSALRRYCGYLATLFLLALLIYRSWGGGITSISKSDRSKEDERESAPSAIDSMAERLFELQSKIILGGLISMTEQQQLAADPAAEAKLRSLVVAMIRSNTFEPAVKASISQNQKQLSSSQSTLGTRLLLKYAVVAKSMGLEDDVQSLWSAASQGCAAEQSIGSICRDLGQALHVSPNVAPLSSEQQASLVDQLGWFGEIASFFATHPEKSLLQYPKSITDTARNVYARFVRSSLVIMLLAFVSFGLLLAFLVLYFRGAIPFQFTIGKINNTYLLEIFALYLAAMMGGSALIELLRASGINLDPTLSNVLMIILMPLVLLWPVGFGYRSRDVLAAIGLRYNGLRDILSQVCWGPVVYVGSALALLVLLLVYSSLLVKLGLDLTQGAHPIVPVLLNSSQEQIVILVIFAVIVAPVVEEIMFRGAFYSFLRGHLGPLGAMFISALVFAAVHPQGAVGVVPLTAIGLILALVREWRDSLIACMATHACFNAGTLTMILVFFS